MGKILRSADFQNNLFFTLQHNQLYFILKSTKYSILKECTAFKAQTFLGVTPMPLLSQDTASTEP